MLIPCVTVLIFLYNQKTKHFSYIIKVGNLYPWDMVTMFYLNPIHPLNIVAIIIIIITIIIFIIIINRYCLCFCFCWSLTH